MKTPHPFTKVAGIGPKTALRLIEASQVGQVTVEHFRPGTRRGNKVVTLLSRKLIEWVPTDPKFTHLRCTAACKEMIEAWL